MGLFKRKESPYYFMKFQANGIRVYESTRTANRKLAEQIYLDRRHEIINGIEPVVRKEPVRDYTFSELADKYLEWCSGRQKSFSRKKVIVKILNNYLKNKLIQDISIEELEIIQSDYIKTKHSINYVNNIIKILKAMFTKAYDWELIDEDVLKRVRKVKQLKGENKRLRYLSEEEAERLISHCEPYLKPVVITALNTGMRKSEILHLTWDRVDLKNRLILLDKTKNGERREVPINNTLFQTLSGLTRHLKCGYIFYNPDTLKPYYDLKKSFGKALKKAHILDFRFHDLRHTFASRLVMKGVDLTTVKELLGHKSITMTLRYSHLASAHIQNAVNILDERCKIVAVDSKEKILKL
jgi:integrase